MPDTTEPEIKVTEDGVNVGFSLSPRSDQGPSRFPNPALRRAHEGGGGSSSSGGGGRHHHHRSHSIDTKDRTSPILGFGPMQGDRSWSIAEASEVRSPDTASASASTSDDPSPHGYSDSPANARSKPYSGGLGVHVSTMPLTAGRKTSNPGSASGSGSPEASYSPDSPRRSSTRIADRLNSHVEGSARRTASPARHFINTPSSPLLQSTRSPSSHVRRISAEHGPSVPYRPPSPVYIHSSSPPTGPINPDPQHSWDSVWPRSSTPDRTDQIRRLGSPAPVDLTRRASLSSHSEQGNLSHSPSSSLDAGSPASASTPPQLGRPKARRPHELRGSSSSPVLRLSPTALRESHEPTKSPRRSLEHSAKSEPVLKVGFGPPSHEHSSSTASQSTDVTPASRVLSPVTEAAPRLDVHNAIISHRSNGSLWPADNERSPSPASSADPKKRSSAVSVPYQLPLPNRTPSPRMSPTSPRSPFMDPSALQAAINGAPVPISESPPKTRSFIAMPPRSGYELSDDPDDVGSEDGSNSEKESVGTTDDDGEDLDEDDDDDMDEDGFSIGDDQDVSVHQGTPEQEKSVPDTPPVPLDRPSLPKRPSLTRSNVVPPPINVAEQSVRSMDPMGNAEASLRSLAAQKSSSASSMLNYFKDDNESGGLSEQQSQVAGDMQFADAVSPLALGFDEQTADQINEAMDEDEDSSAVENAEESLNTLERIFLFAKSDMAYHRVLVSQSLPDWIREVELNDAVEYIIPLLNGLATDEPEVCAAFAPEVGRVMWFFFRNCPIAESPEDDNETHTDQDKERATRPRISVTTFTTLLCALLLNQNTLIAGATQQSLIQLFYRLLKRDLELTKEELAEKSPDEVATRQREQDLDGYVQHASGRDGQPVPHQDYHFDASARSVIMTELLENVALALAQVSQLRLQGEHEGAAADDSTDTALWPVPDEGQNSGTKTQDEDMDEEEMPESQNTHEIDSQPRSTSTNDNMAHESGANSNTWAPNDTIFGNHDSFAGSEPHVEEDGDEEAAVGRMASVSLLSALAADELIPQDRLLERFAPEILNLISDPAFYVRKEVAAALGPLSKNMSVADVVDKLLPALDKGIHDFNWHVRQAACFSLPTVLTRLDPSLRREKTLVFMRALVNDISRQLRATALEVIGETIYMFHEDPDGVPPELIRFYLGESFDMAPQQGDASLSLSFDKTSDLEGTEALFAEEEEAGMDMDSEYRPQSGSNEQSLLASFGFADNEPSSTAGEPWDGHFNASGPERPLVMAFNFPAVVLTVGQSQWNRLKHKHAELTQSPAFKVRKSLAASLHEVAKIVGSDATRDDLLPAAQRFLRDDDGEVRSAMLENIDVFLSCLPQLEAEEVLRSLLEQWSADFTRDWRLRECLALHIASMSKQFLLEDEEGSLVSLMQLALSDPISAVRDAGVLCVPDLYRIFSEHDQVIADGFLGMVSDLGESQGYRLRIASLLCIKALVESGIQRSSCELLLLNRLTQLGQDPVVDVRIILAKLVSIMCQRDELYAMPQSRSAELKSLIAQLAQDNSSEVREPVSGILLEQELEQYRVAPTTYAPAGKLVLGPAEGGPHKPTSDGGFTMDFFGDQDSRDNHVFEMDDDVDDDVDVIVSVDELEEQPDQNDNVDDEQESQQYEREQQMASEPADYLERSRAELLREKASTSSMPSPIDSGWLSANGPTFFEYTDDKEEYEDEPHHLLSVDKDSSESGGLVDSDNEEETEEDQDADSSSHWTQQGDGDESQSESVDSESHITLSSPQRGADGVLTSSDGAATTEGESSPSRSAAGSKTSDPFLAFVAGRQSNPDVDPVAAASSSSKRGGSIANGISDAMSSSQQKQKIQHNPEEADVMGGKYHSKRSGDWSKLPNTTDSAGESLEDEM